MKKLFKFIAWTVVIVVVLAVGAPLLAIQFVDPAWVKSELEAQAKARTGRTLSIKGDVALTAYPWLGAEVGQVSFGNAAGFSETPFASVDKARVRVKLMPLLQKRVEMDTVTAEGLVLNLERAKDGRSNLDDLAALGQTQDQQGGAPPVAALALGGLEVTGGRVTWRDAVEGWNVTVTDLDLTTGGFDLDATELPVTASFKFDSKTPGVAGQLDLKATAIRPTGDKIWRAQGTQLALKASGAVLDGGSLDTTFTADVAYDAATGAVTLSKASVALPQLKRGTTEASLKASAAELSVDPAKGQVRARGFALDVSRFAQAGMTGSLQASGDPSIALDTRTVRIGGLQAKGSVSGGALGKAPLPFELSGDLLVDGAKNVAAMPGMVLVLPKFDVDGTQGDLRLEGDLAAELPAERIRFAALKASGALAGRALQGGKTKLALTGAVDVRPGAGTFVLTGFDLRLDDLATQGLTGALRAQGNATGNAATRVWSVKGLKATTALAGQALPGGKLDAKLDADAVLNLAKQTLSVSSYTLDTADLDAKGNFNVSGLDKEPVFRGDIAIAPFSPRALLAKLGQPVPDTRDAKALTSASLGATFSGTPSRISLKPLVLKLDDTTVRGELAAAGFPAPRYRFDLKVDGLNADRYMPPESRAQAASPGAAAAAATTLPMETLQALNAEGELTIGNLRMANLRISNVRMVMNGKDGLVRLSPLSARLYDGAYAGNVTLDARGKVAKVSVDEKLNGVQLGALLKDLQGNAPITGAGNLTARLTAQGSNGDALVRALNGDVAFQIDNGAIQKIDIVRSICNLVQGAQGGETRFDQMTGSARVVNGVVENDQLAVNSPLLRIGARGVVDLPREVLDYRGTVALVGSCRGQGGKARDDLSGIDVPIRVTGPISNPSPSIDTGAIAQAVLKREVERKASRVTDKLTEKLGDQAGKALGGEAKKAAESLIKGLFGN